MAIRVSKGPVVIKLGILGDTLRLKVPLRNSVNMDLSIAVPQLKMRRNDSPFKIYVRI